MIPAEPLRSRFCCLLVVNDLAPYSLIFLLHGSYAFSTFDTDVKENAKLLHFRSGRNDDAGRESKCNDGQEE